MLNVLTKINIATSSTSYVQSNIWAQNHPPRAPLKLSERAICTVQWNVGIRGNLNLDIIYLIYDTHVGEGIEFAYASKVLPKLTQGEFAGCSEVAA